MWRLPTQEVANVSKFQPTWLRFIDFLRDSVDQSEKDVRHPIVRGIGFTLLGLVGFGLFLTVIKAAAEGRSFYGVNYYGLRLGTYSALATLLLVALLGVAGAIVRLRRSRRAVQSGLQFWVYDHAPILGFLGFSVAAAVFAASISIPLGPPRLVTGRIEGFRHAETETGGYPIAIIKVDGALRSVALPRDNNCVTGGAIRLRLQRHLVGNTGTPDRPPCGSSGFLETYR